VLCQRLNIEVAYQPHPLNPPLLEKERGKINKRGLSPLKLPRKESQREAKPLLINYFPLP